jgi:hypothetical protein
MGEGRSVHNAASICNTFYYCVWFSHTWVNDSKSDDSTARILHQTTSLLRTEKCIKIQENEHCNPDAKSYIVMTSLMDDREIKINGCEISWVPSPRLRAAELTKLRYYTVSNFQKSVWQKQRLKPHNKTSTNRRLYVHVCHTQDTTTTATNKKCETEITQSESLNCRILESILRK